MTKFLNMNEFASKLRDRPEIIKELIEDEPNYKIAKTIIEERIKKGLSQNALAKKAKLTQTQISRLESAQLGNYTTISKALNALDLEIIVVSRDSKVVINNNRSKNKSNELESSVS